MKRFNQKFPFKGHKNVQDNSIKILMTLSGLPAQKSG